MEALQVHICLGIVDCCKYLVRGWRLTNGDNLIGQSQLLDLQEQYRGCSVPMLIKCPSLAWLTLVGVNLQNGEGALSLLISPKVPYTVYYIV